MRSFDKCWFLVFEYFRDIFPYRYAMNVWDKENFTNYDGFENMLNFFCERFYTFFLINQMLFMYIFI